MRAQIPPKRILSLYILLLIGFKWTLALQRCHACFDECGYNSSAQLQFCDCRDTTCWGQSCYAKVEIWHEEKIAAIQKGCSNDIPGGVAGCQYAGQKESIHCFCKGDFCNNPRDLNHYNTNPLPRVDCCQCSESQGDSCTGRGECENQCTGNYCFLDTVSSDHGCGWGYPRLQNFLRTENNAKWRATNTCARYIAGKRSLVHGCTCSKPVGNCNNREDMSKELLQRVNNSTEGNHFCYSLYRTSKFAINESVFKRSGTCEGHFCFITMQTYEVAIEPNEYESDEQKSSQHHYVAKMTPYFELLAGCLTVDNIEKVEEGCHYEYQVDRDTPMKKHCVCRSHLCNYYRLLGGSTGGVPARSRVTANDEPEWDETAENIKQRQRIKDQMEQARGARRMPPEDIPVPVQVLPPKPTSAARRSLFYGDTTVKIIMFLSVLLYLRQN